MTGTNYHIPDVQFGYADGIIKNDAVILCLHTSYRLNYTWDSKCCINKIDFDTYIPKHGRLLLTLK